MVDYKLKLTVEQKLEAIRVSARHEFPVGDIDIILAEIERGRSGTSVTNPAPLKNASTTKSNTEPCKHR